jgi:hypothetical protein
MEKIFNQKSFIYCLDTIVWVVELTYIWIFSFKITSRCKLSDIVPIICQRCHWHQWQIYCCYHYTSGKVCHWINNTSGTDGKICRQCRWYLWRTLTCEYLPEFSKKFEMTLLLFFQGLGGRWFMKKTWIKKSCDTVPLMGCFKVPSPYFLFKICFYPELSKFDTLEPVFFYPADLEAYSAYA